MMWLVYLRSHLIVFKNFQCFGVRMCALRIFLLHFDRRPSHGHRFLVSFRHISLLSPFFLTLVKFDGAGRKRVGMTKSEIQCLNQIHEGKKI